MIKIEEENMDEKEYRKRPESFRELGRKIKSDYQEFKERVKMRREERVVEKEAKIAKKESLLKAALTREEKKRDLRKLKHKIQTTKKRYAPKPLFTFGGTAKGTIGHILPKKPIKKDMFGGGYGQSLFGSPPKKKGKNRPLFDF